jgi:uncharacterized repeat protein (TIGR03803 family)
MTTSEQPCAAISCRNLPIRSVLLSLLGALIIVFVFPTAYAQTFTVLHNFSGGGDGANPHAGLSIDGNGNLYGTTTAGGYFGTLPPCSQAGCGTVFKLAHTQSGWTSSPLYSFHGNDGAGPAARVIFGPDGSLFGTTGEGGSARVGTVFNLRPPVSICKTVACPWTQSVLWDFVGSPDGANPGLGDVVFDHAGNLYGTTELGGGTDSGTVFKMTPVPAGGWRESINFSFGAEGSHGGESPNAGIIFDSNNNMYTTAVAGGSSGCGTVSQLVTAGSGRNEIVLYSFTCGSYNGPTGGVIFNPAGDLLGTTATTGGSGGGNAFELSPSSGSWSINALHSFTGVQGSSANLVMDAAGNFYGTTVNDGAYQNGNVFKLSPSNGGWVYTSLHDFTGGNDGAHSEGQVVMDTAGNLYGTTSNGGAGTACGGGCGVVWEITP